MKVADVLGEAGDGLGARSGVWCLGGEGFIDIAGFFEEAIEEGCGGGIVDLIPEIGGDEAVLRKAFPRFAGGGEGTDDGGGGVG